MAVSQQVSTNLSDDNLLLTWNLHKKQLIDSMQVLFDEESHFDCALWADGVSMECHRIVLSACSPFLRDIIREHPGDRPFITLAGLSKSELHAIVEYIYTGETSITNEQLESFLETCRFLELMGLKEYVLVNSDVAPPYSDAPFDLKSEEIDLSPTMVTEDYFADTSADVKNERTFFNVEPSTSGELFELEDNSSVTGNIFKGQQESVETGERNIETFYQLHRQTSEKKRYKCSKCGNSYSHKRTLLHHVHWICNQPATYACTLCPYMGKRKYQLKSHLSHFHSIEVKRPKVGS